MESSSKKRKSHTDTVKPSKKKKQSSKQNDAHVEFHLVTASLTLSVPPMFANNPRAGVEEMLDSMIMRYIPAFRGIVLSHSNLSFTKNSATIKGDCPFLVCSVNFDATVWSPRVVGKVNLCSPDHISLLIHRTFNASIPRHHIPADEWHFEYGPAENDPEFGAGAGGEECVEDHSGEVSAEEKESAGNWVHRLTGERLGGDQGYLEFTVIGLTVANEMLSLQGSIQIDPFSPRHAPRATHSTQQSEEAETGTEEVEAELEDSDDEASSGADTFKILGRQVVQAMVVEKRKRKPEESEQETEAPKKRKRKGKKT